MNMTKKGNTALLSAREALSSPADFDAFLAKLGAKDRLNVERHLAACETETDSHHADIWKRMARALFTLSPHAVQTAGQQAVQFFVADGKYRMQVFAMEDLRDGKIQIYTPDALEQALSAGLFTPPTDEESNAFSLKRESHSTLIVEQLDAVNTPNPAAYYKHMLGWNRKALRITLLVNANDAQLAAAEDLCALAAAKWTKAPAAQES